MRVTLTEHESNFHLSLEAENIQEAALITRFGINGLRNPFTSWVEATGEFRAFTNFKKHRRGSGRVHKCR